MSSETEITSPSSDRVPLSAWYSLLVLTLVLLFAVIDRAILGLMAEPVKQTLGLSDLQLGLMQGTGIAVFAALAAFPISWLSDRYGRRVVLAGSVLLWSLAVLGCAFAQTFEQMFIATSLVGAGEAGLAPITFALIPELFARSKRQLANSIFVIAATAGGGVGLVVSGQLTVIVEAVRHLLPENLQLLENWRLSFLLAAAPAPIMMLLIGTIRVVHTKQVEAGSQQAGGASVSLLEHLRAHRQTLLSFFGGMGMATFAFGAIGSWMSVILIRMFDESPADIGKALGIISILGIFSAFLFSTVILRVLEKRVGPILQVRVMWIAALLCLCTSFALAFAGSAQQIYMIQAVQVLCLTAANMLFPTVLQNLAPAPLRARVVAIQTTVNVSFGAAAAPTVGLISDSMYGSENGLLVAASTVACCALVVAAFLLHRSERGYLATIDEVARQDQEQPGAAQPQHA